MGRALGVVVATFNRGPILQKCLSALLGQTLSADSYEIVVVDDGSTDDTPAMVAALRTAAPGHTVRYQWQINRGRSQARNVGIGLTQAEIVVFIDSDVVVVPDFLATHLAAHRAHTGRRIFVQGLAVNTDRFDDPTASPVTSRDVSMAFFATNNVSVPKAYIEEAGGFDERFTEYGWEDLELGLRLKNLGVGIVRSRAARGFHWHPRFSLGDLPGMRSIEVQRGRMAATFYRKHPTWAVRLMIQLTPLHRLLDALLTAGGHVDERRVAPLLQWLLDRGHPVLAQHVAIVVLNQYNIRALHEALAGLPAP